jgi:hypothetical protein
VSDPIDGCLLVTYERLPEVGHTPRHTNQTESGTTMNNCRECSVDNSFDARFCTSCGFVMPPQPVRTGAFSATSSTESVDAGTYEYTTPSGGYVRPPEDFGPPVFGSRDGNQRSSTPPPPPPGTQSSPAQPNAGFGSNLTEQQRQYLKYGAGAAAAAAILLLLAKSGVLGDALGGLVGGIAIIVFVLAIVGAWTIPVWIAVKRDHPSKMSIIVVNLVFGWTFLGWMIALIWSLSNDGSRNNNATVVINQGTVAGHATMAPQPPAPSAYQVGDVVNGFRYTGIDWVEYRPIGR